MSGIKMENNLSTIIEIITTKFPNCQAIYLFGSSITKYFNEASDVDIAVLLPYPEVKKVGRFYSSDLSLELEQKLKKDIDLINLRQVSTVFQMEIITKGKCIFSKNKCRTNEFEALVFSFYQKLNEERKDILNNLREKYAKS
jgi:predicted nucleotidyltransferase